MKRIFSILAVMAAVMLMSPAAQADNLRLGAMVGADISQQSAVSSGTDYEGYGTTTGLYTSYDFMPFMGIELDFRYNHISSYGTFGDDADWYMIHVWEAALGVPFIIGLSDGISLRIVPMFAASLIDNSDAIPDPPLGYGLNGFLRLQIERHAPDSIGIGAFFDVGYAGQWIDDGDARVETGGYRVLLGVNVFYDFAL